MLLYALVEEGLTALGAARTLPIVQEAKCAIFGSEPVTLAAQTEKLRWSLENQTLRRFLDGLDSRFYEDPDELWERLQDFGVTQGFYPQRWIDT